MYRVSVTTIEKFRRYMTEASAYDTEEALVESLKGLFTGNDKTKFGGAYHKVIEGDFIEISGQVKVKEKENDFVFTPEQAKPALDFRKAHPFMIHEMDVKKVYETAFFPIQVSARVDGIEGSQIHDAKTKFRALSSVNEYVDSCQGKFYLDILGLDVFHYNIFEIKGFDGLIGKSPFHFKDVQIIRHEPITCARYEYMDLDLHTLLNDFLEYLHNRNYVSLLKPASEEIPLNF
jgi:hypothetical protein